MSAPRIIQINRAGVKHFLTKAIASGALVRWTKRENSTLAYVRYLLLEGWLDNWLSVSGQGSNWDDSAEGRMCQAFAKSFPLLIDWMMDASSADLNDMNRLASSNLPSISIFKKHLNNQLPSSLGSFRR